jgi:hypothetical protein
MFASLLIYIGLFVLSWVLWLSFPARSHSFQLLQSHVKFVRVCSRNTTLRRGNGTSAGWYCSQTYFNGWCLSLVVRSGALWCEYSPTTFEFRTMRKQVPWVGRDREMRLSVPNKQFKSHHVLVSSRSCQEALRILGLRTVVRDSPSSSSKGPRKNYDLLVLDREECRLETGFLTGHCTLRRDLG